MDSNSTTSRVRPAGPSDALEIGVMHYRGLSRPLKNLPSEVPETILAGFDAGAIGAHWAQAVNAPPLAGANVLVAVDEAIEGTGVVGFISSAPAQEEAAGPGEVSGHDSAVAVLMALEVHEEHQRQGHGSRLMTALVETLREQGFAALITWVDAGDSARIRFLQDSGFGPAGPVRHLDVGGQKLTEHAWHTAL